MMCTETDCYNVAINVLEGASSMLGDDFKSAFYNQCLADFPPEEEFGDTAGLEDCYILGNLAGANTPECCTYFSGVVVNGITATFPDFDTADYA
jgi:hypothetical protein